MSDTSGPQDSETVDNPDGRPADASGTADPVHVDGTAHLDDVVASNDLVLVDFYADWCGPCQMLEPVVERIAAETAATVAKVDVDAAQELAREFGVQGVPTLVLFVDGDPAERLVGMQDEATLVELVERYR